VEHENWQAEKDIQTIVSFEELACAHESKGIHAVVAIRGDEQLGEMNRRCLYMVTKMIGFPMVVLLVTTPG